MDALRASTMLMLVPVHAALLLSFNGYSESWATGIFWVVHVFRLPLFFALSGFFLVFLVTSRGAGYTARNRTLRIAVPLVVAFLTILPASILLAGKLDVSASPAQAAGVVDTGDGDVTIGPGFLWFLWYLLIIDAVAALIWWRVPALLRLIARPFAWALRTPGLGTAALALLTAAAISVQPEWYVPGPANTFAPDLGILAYYVGFFIFGAVLCQNRETLAAAGAGLRRWAPVAIVATAVAGALFIQRNDAFGEWDGGRPLGILALAVATWASLYALLGIAARFNRPRRRIRYMADASYWIYLSHLPAQIVLIAGVLELGLGLAPAWLIVTAGSLAWSLVTYALFVRYTAIGTVLNGPRRREGGDERRRASASAPAVP